MRLPRPQRFITALMVATGLSVTPASAQDATTQKIHGIDGATIEVYNSTLSSTAYGVTYVCSEDKSHQLVALFDISVTAPATLNKDQRSDIVNAAFGNVEGKMSTILQNPVALSAVAAGEHITAIRSYFRNRAEEMESAHKGLNIQLIVPDMLSLQGCGNITTIDTFVKLHRAAVHQRLHMHRA